MLSCSTYLTMLTLRLGLRRWYVDKRHNYFDSSVAINKWT